MDLGTLIFVRASHARVDPKSIQTMSTGVALQQQSKSKEMVSARSLCSSHSRRFARVKKIWLTCCCSSMFLCGIRRVCIATSVYEISIVSRSSFASSYTDHARRGMWVADVRCSQSETGWISGVDGPTVINRTFESGNMAAILG